MLQVANVKCRISKWITTTMSEKCLTLWVLGFKWCVEFFEWVSVLSSDEWVRCRIFELVKGWSNKRSRKPPKANLHASHHCHCEKDRHAKRLLTKGYHAKGVSTKGIKLYNVVGSHTSLIAIRCQVRVSFLKPWSQ
jgi:hypothetical protein